MDLSTFILALPGEVALLKIDIEGAELALVRRLIESGAYRRVKRGFVEMHDGHVPGTREYRIPGSQEEARGLRELVRTAAPRTFNLDWH